MMNSIALQALSSMLACKGEEAVMQDMLPEVAACLLDCLAGHCSLKSALPLDRPSSRYFYSILRTMQAALSQVRGWHTKLCAAKPSLRKLQHDSNSYAWSAQDKPCT